MFNIIILHALLYYMHRWLRQNTRSHPFHFVMAWSISQQNPVWWCLVFRGFKCFAQEVELRRIQENSTVCVFRAANLLLFHDSLLPALTIDSEQLFSLVFFCCFVDLSLSLVFSINVGVQASMSFRCKCSRWELEEQDEHKRIQTYSKRPSVSIPNERHAGKSPPAYTKSKHTLL